MAKNIVLIPGWQAKISNLLPLARKLEELGWKVFLPELPGFEAPPPKKIWGISEYADFVFKKSFDFFKGESFYLFGHSFGGRLAIKLGSGNREKIEGLVLCSTAGLSRPNILKRYFFLFLAKVGKLFPFLPIKGFFRKLIYKLAREQDYLRTTGVMRGVFKKVVGEDLKPLVSKINSPVLIVWGKKDKATPISDAFYLKNKLPRARLIVFEEEGHRLPYDKPKEVAREIEKWYRWQNS